MRGNLYQYTLIGLGAISTALLGIFFYREIAPEYKIYQDDYIAIEKFRSGYTHESPPLFKTGVKQILIEKKDKGDPTIDRCISCHVALEFPHFSSTKIERDINGNIVVNAKGIPQKVKNEEYVWAKIDQKIAALGNTKEAQELKDLKIAHVGEQTFDVTKVLAMHPLMGKETRPFEFHPMEEYGCTSCHNGNGRGLTTLTAHGPVFDGQYEKEFMGPKPQFTEIDPDNDPPFARIFNGKPGHELLFQTTPIYVGALIEAKCMQCHQSSGKAIENVINTASDVTLRRKKQTNAVLQGLKNDESSAISLLKLQKNLMMLGVESTLQILKEKSENYALPKEEREQAVTQLQYLKGVFPATFEKMKTSLEGQLIALIGTPKLTQELAKELSLVPEKDLTAALQDFIQKNKGLKDATGSIFAKLTALDLEKQIELHITDINHSFQTTTRDQKAITGITSDIDNLTTHYQRGQKLFIAESCYACHRIAGFARGGVGPELTQSGEGYPWYIKESIVWPQADLRTSTMPNFVLDHEELQDLVTYLLGQTGGNNAISPTAYKTAIQEWEGGKKQEVEKPISPAQMRDLRFAMTTFATEGCASCHRLKGFDSNVGFRIEKQSPSFTALQEEKKWFKTLIPEEITGTTLVKNVENHASEIDQHIANDVRTNGLLEEIEASHPGIIETYYTPFKFASRAKDAFYKSQLKNETDPSQQLALQKEWHSWKQRIHSLMLLYAQEYGVGRLIGPRPNWSGLFRSDEWLMEHFKNPSSHVPRSIMPVFPFDETKFYSLTLMLDTLALRNRDETRAIWEHQGFNPELAYNIHCAQCHGDFLQGNGPVATWIYPIPKNLRNAEFLRNLTKERAIQSITHGVQGTPMPPFGEVASDKPAANGIPELTQAEIQKLVDWLFSSLPGGNVIRSSEDVPKWNYSPQDIVQELNEEGSKSISGNVSEIFDVIKTPSTLTPQEYYIQKKYYTPKNLAAGQQFFELNCAVCHGKDADGAGLRAGTMIESKPRMLTNLDWIKTHDDLRLIRSIKFGVAGTAMNPWGDFTSAEQRMQLVMFIRSLSEEKSLREQLMEALYKTFDAPDLSLELIRAKNNGESNDSLLKLKTLLKSEKELYLNSGLELIQNNNLSAFSQLIEVINILRNRFQNHEDQLSYHFSENQEKQVTLLEEQILAKVTKSIEAATQNKINIHEPLQLQEINTHLTTLSKLKNTLTYSFAEAARLRQQEKLILNTQPAKETNNE